MNIKDFVSVRKTLRTIQNLQSNAKVYVFGISMYKEENECWFCVTVFKTKESIPKNFYFTELMGVEGRRKEYDEITNFIHSK